MSGMDTPSIHNWTNKSRSDTQGDYRQVPTTLTELLLERLAPFLTPDVDPNGDHTNFVSALAAPAEQLFGLLWDQNDPDDPDYVPGWSPLFDVDLCPEQFLPFLGQMVGVPSSALQGLSDSNQRQLIRAEAGQSRGTPGAILSAAQRHLAPGAFIVLQERLNGLTDAVDAYAAVLGFRTADLLTTEQDLINAVEAVKPGGIQIVYVSTAGFTWNEALHTFAADTFSFNAAFATQP